MLCGAVLKGLSFRIKSYFSHKIDSVPGWLLVFLSSSNIYEDVKSNSDIIWKFERTEMIIEFIRKPCLPIPLSMLAVIWSIIKTIVGKLQIKICEDWARPVGCSRSSNLKYPRPRVCCLISKLSSATLAVRFTVTKVRSRGDEVEKEKKKSIMFSTFFHLFFHWMLPVSIFVSAQLVLKRIDILIPCFVLLRPICWAI